MGLSRCKRAQETQAYLNGWLLALADLIRTSQANEGNLRELACQYAAKAYHDAGVVLPVADMVRAGFEMMNAGLGQQNLF